MAKVAPHSETVQAAKALQELTRKLATEPEKFSSAVVAINKALCEVRNYLKYRRGGGERNDEMENRLSALWNDVAEQIHPYDRELAYLCMVKGHGWADESVWAMPKYKNLPIKLDQMLHRLQRSQSPTPAPDLISTKEDQSGNRVDRWISAAKDNPVTAILIFVAILLGGVASVSESLRSIVKPIYSSIPDEAPLLTRLDTENLLQSNRGNIERCLATHEQKFFSWTLCSRRVPDTA